MIIIRINGGLGNQMFQYALGKAIAKKNSTELKLDISWFSKEVNSNRKYELNIFQIEEKFATKYEIHLLKYKKGIIGKIKKIIDKNKPYYKRRLVKEFSMEYDLNILKISDNSYLDGYWQSEKYFNHIKTCLMDEFTLRKNIIFDKDNIKMLENISALNSVSLHIRRGDYVTNKKTNTHHGTCSVDYYKKAINYIASKIKNPNFFIFSDDLEWVKENLGIKFPVNYVNINNNKQNYFDLILMSKCKHNIIANSSFSWWGAWLNKNHEKIVISPKEWFADDVVSSQDIIPEKWIKI